MKIFLSIGVIIGLVVSNVVAQYGIPDDDDEPRVRAPNPAFIISKYGESKLEYVSVPKPTTHEFDFRVAQPQHPVGSMSPSRVIFKDESEYPKYASLRFPEKPLGYPTAQPFLAPVLPAYAAPNPDFVRQSGYPQESYSLQPHPINPYPVLRKDTVPIVSFVMESDNRGTFNLETVSGNGITKQTSGHLKDLGDKEGPVQVMSGSYSYTGDDGKLYRVDWKADENGYTTNNDYGAY